MYLARDKHGRLGRQVKSFGENAVVESAPVVADHRNIYVSNESIIQDDLNARYDDRKKRAEARAMQIAQKRAQALEMARQRQGMLLAQEQQVGIPEDKDNAAIRNYFIRQANMSETERMNRSMKADFYDREMVPGLPTVSRAFNPRADFSTNAITGSPLTNDGSFGPSTDYDRFVYGTELDNDRIEDGAMIVGGTMLGRYDGKTIGYSPKGLKRSWKGMNGYRGMGDEFEEFEAMPEDEIEPEYEIPETPDQAEEYEEYDEEEETQPEEPGFFSKVWSGLTTGVATGVQTEAAKIPGRLQADVQRQTQVLIQQGLSPQQAQATAVKQVKISQAKGPIQKLAAQLGVPVWVLYVGLGTVAVGGVALVMKKRK